MNKILTGVLLCCFAMGNALAGKKVVDSATAAKWASDLSFSKCGLNSPATGVMKKTGKDTALLKKGDIYWIAWELNANGGKFCPTQVGALRTSANNPYTTYYNVPGIDCIWLCQDGQGGTECNSSVGEVSGEKKIVQSTTSSNSDNTNREDSIAMLVANKYEKCRGNNSYKPWNADGTQEHDVVLAVTGYSADGYGAYVQPLVVRAAARPVGSYWGDYGKGYAFAYLANDINKKLVCLNGYKYNSAGNGCVKYTPAQAAKEQALEEVKTKSEKACSGWVISTTDAFLNTYKVEQVGNCYQYRCKNSAMGFKDDMDKTCVKCNSDNQYGVNPETGVCVVCNEKQTFNKGAKDTGYCKDKMILTPGHLQYGIGNPQDTALEAQCWYKLQKEGFEAYKDCIVTMK